MPTSAYLTPGVSVTEDVSPSVAPLSAVPSIVAIVGTAQGFITSSERYILTGVAQQTLLHTGVNTATVSVLNVTQAGATVAAGNYQVVQTANPDGINASGDEIYAVARVAPPATAPTVTNSGTGTLSATYQYAVSFVTPGGVTGETAIGPASGSIIFSNQGGNLSNIPLGPASTTARKVYRAKVTGSVVGTFYLVTTIADNVTTTFSNETLSDASAVLNGPSDQGINSGDTIQITYQYTDQNYYAPTLFSTYPDVVNAYGPPFDSNGLISSNLSYAIRLAFINGAQQVLGVAAASSANSDISTAVTRLADQENVSIVSVVSGNPSDHATLAAHCASMATLGLYRLGVVGQDSSNQTISPATLRGSAQAFNVENMILISPSSFNITNPVSLKPMAIGAQYMASAILGMFAARDPQIPLTRKTVAGFLSPNEIRTNADASLDSASGLFVVEFKGNIFRVRHALTTLVTDINKRESSVVRSKYEMARQLRVIIDSTIVGIVVPQTEAPGIVTAAVTTVLDQLVTFGTISSYQNVVSRVLASTPTTVETRFQYTPAYPIDNVSIIFTINTQSGDFSLNF